MRSARSRDAATAGPAGEPEAGPLVSHAEPVMGTVVSFAVRPAAGQDQAAARQAIAAACRVLHQADETFSTYRAASPVSRLRRGEAGPAALPAEVAEVLELCAQAKAASGGWFDPWAMPGGVDPTGLVKGWAVERAAGVLRDAGAAAAMVNGGGDIAVFGRPGPGPAWRAGIQHPWRPAALACIVEVRAAVATSGRYERGAHLLDPFTGGPAGRAASATVTGPSLPLADALATALAAGGDEVLRRIGALAGYAGYLIRPDGTEADAGGMPFAR